MSAAIDVTKPAAADKRGWTEFETLFGVVLPIICLAMDLYLLKLGQLAPLAIWGVAFLGILVFILARFKIPLAIGEIMLGMLYASAAVTALICIALLWLIGDLMMKGGAPLPLSSIYETPLLFVIAYGVMSLGLVPLFTAKAFYNRAVAFASRSKKRDTWLIALGVFLLIGLPLAAHYTEYRWLEARWGAVREYSRRSALTAKESEARLKALRALNQYPLSFGRTSDYACWVAKNGTSIDEATMRELESMVGVEIGRSINLACSLP